MRRTIGAKKDEFRLNRKHISKNDVVSLLESAGFSRSNPYYIVRQGKIDQICQMTEKQRLDLLKEVAGTRVYDERRKKASDIMAESDTWRSQIAKNLEVVDGKLSDLEHEKTELQAYQELDRNHRALRYCIYNAEHDETRVELGSMNEAIEDAKRELEEHNQEATTCAETLRQQEEAAANSAHTVEATKTELDRQERASAELEETKVTLNIKISMLTSQITAKEKEQREIKKESKALEVKIADLRAKIDNEVNYFFYGPAFIVVFCKDVDFVHLCLSID